MMTKLLVLILLLVLLLVLLLFLWPGNTNIQDIAYEPTLKLTSLI